MDGIREKMLAKIEQENGQLAADDPVFDLIEVVITWINANNDLLLKDLQKPLEDLVAKVVLSERKQAQTLSSSIKMVEELLSIAPKIQREILETELRNKIREIYAERDRKVSAQPTALRQQRAHLSWRE
jgi:hypothetical protein